MMRRRMGLATLAILLIMMALAAFSTAFVFAQATAQPPTLAPTSPFDFGIPPTITPQPSGTALPISLSGVNGYADNDAVIIRIGPGIGYRRIGTLPRGQSIDIIGYNGYSLSRPCTANFAADLDMWVMVRTGETTGWMARCALRIVGEFNLVRMLVNRAPTGLATPIPVTPTVYGLPIATPTAAG